MPSRRQHAKSRHGCLTCKSRKVKCDFQRPVCGHCWRRKERCNFPDDVLEPSHADNRSQYRIFNHSRSQVPTKLLNQEQLLLRHFVAKISVMLSDRTDFQTVWSLHLPRDSYDHPYLMHSMLAVSALYLGLAEKANKSSDASFYMDLALYHHNLALSHLTPTVTKVTVTNFDALYGSSMLAVLFNIGLLTFSNSSQLANEIATISGLAKGTLAIRQEGVETHKIKSSHLLRKYHPWDFSPSLPTATNRIMTAIERIVESFPENTKYSENKPLYIRAVEVLRMTLEALTQNPDHPQMIYMWFSLVDHRFIELLGRKDTIALLILAHYAMCMLQHRHRMWAATCARYMISAIYNTLNDSDRISLSKGDI